MDHQRKSLKAAHSILCVDHQKRSFKLAESIYHVLITKEEILKSACVHILCRSQKKRKLKISLSLLNVDKKDYGFKVTLPI